MRFKALPLALMALYALPVLAQSPAGFVVRNIRVEGNQRIETGTIFNYLPIHPGETVTRERAEQAMRALYATGLFQDVRLRDDHGTLVVVVQERPSITSVTVNGAKDISKDDILKGLRASGIAPARVYNQAEVAKAITDLKQAYAARGHYNTQINATATPEPRNRVALTFNITEGPVTKIHQISITGNQVFPTTTLLHQFTLRPPGLLTRFTHNDQYSREKLEADLERLRSFYLDRGYLDFRITNVQVSETPDKTGVDIAISVSEGAQYHVSAVRLAGNLILPEPELAKLISLHPGDLFSRKELTASIQRIGDRLGDEGYAFVNVQAEPQIDAQNHMVALTLNVQPGHRVYVRRINISGNVKTADKVIRREFRQVESGWYNTSAIKRSRERLNRLGYFEDVTVNAVPVPGTTDQVDLNVVVKERSTGQITAGLGYSSVDKLFITAGVSQSNLFGTGNTGSININTGKVSRVLALSYTNPYYTPNGVSRGFDLYSRRFDSSKLTGLAPYVTTTTGAGVRYGIPLSENNSAHVGVAIENTRIGLFPGSPLRYQQFVQRYGNSNTVAPITLGWTNDTRDSLIFPTRGHLNNLSTEIGIGSLHYYKFNYQGQIYQPITANTTLFLNGNLGYGGGQLPFYKNFYAGGPNSVRGYAWGSIGPKDPVDQVALGGTRLATANLEYLFPLPGMADNKNVRMSVFLDAGDVWGGGPDAGLDNTFSVTRIRYSVGVGVNWYSPLGPLQFSLAKAIRRQPEDQAEPFQFSIGTAF